MDKEIKGIIQQIQRLKKQYEEFLPDIEQQVDRIIEANITDENEIGHLLDRILDMTSLSVGDDLYFKLLEYYKTFDPEAAADYLRYYKEFDE